MAELSLGLARARVGPAAALVDHERRAIAACEENRLTRARDASAAGAPHLAIGELLGYLERSARDVSAVGAVCETEGRGWLGSWRVDREVHAHEAHATYAFRAGGLPDALVLVSEVHHPDGWTAWRHDARTRRLERAGEGLGTFPLARIYGRLTDALGLQAMRDEHLVEAMARVGRRTQPAIASQVRMDGSGVVVDADFENAVQSACAAGDETTRLDIAASVQFRLGECLIELLSRLRRAEPRTAAGSALCLSGGLFFNTCFTTIAGTAASFDGVFVPPHPGRNGSAVGAALLANDSAEELPASVVGSPYLGPAYSDARIKETLDNCKLLYDYVPGDRLNEIVLRDLASGRLVGWFSGRLEWGPRALGHRSVLTDPFAPHALENLNGFLKRRPWYRSYGVSVPAARLDDFFVVEPTLRASPFMQFEFRPRDIERFRTVLPRGVETLRVHTVDESEPRFLRLLEMWGQKTGAPVLVNTSFNGFHEPLVCSPRDAIRVFYGTGLDTLALGDFVLRK